MSFPGLVPRCLLGVMSILLLMPLVGAAPAKTAPSIASNSANQTPTAKAGQLNLSVVEAAGVTREGPTLAQHDFGTVIQSDGNVIRYTFVLRNDNAVPVTISRIQGSCGCTTGSAQSAEHQTLPWTAAPGQTLLIETAVDVSHLSPGPLDKFVSVVVQGQSWPAATLELTGTLVASGAEAKPQVDAGQQAPQFTLADTQGRSQSLSAYRGRAVALFFFCGCPWCMECAKAWAQGQQNHQETCQGSSVKAAPSQQKSVTLIVFSGDKAAATAFAKETGLDKVQAVFLPDAQMQVTGTYHADPCPRVFVVDPTGTVRYTNNHAADAPRVASPQEIVKRAQRALNAKMLF